MTATRARTRARARVRYNTPTGGVLRTLISGPNPTPSCDSVVSYATPRCMNNGGVSA